MALDPMKTKPPVKNPARCINCGKKGPTRRVKIYGWTLGHFHRRIALVCVSCARRW
jgi:hypothetical protein